MTAYLAVFTLSIAAGRAEPASPFLSPFKGGKAFPQVQFYGLVDLAGQPFTAEALRGQEALQRALRRGRGSLTGAMERAVARAFREVGQEGLTVGVTCVALRGMEVYVARWGGGTVLHYRRGQVVQPNAPGEGWLERFDLLPGEALVVGNTSLQDLLSPQAREAVLAAEPDEAARRVYLLGRELPQVSALFIRAR